MCFADDEESVDDGSFFAEESVDDGDEVQWVEQEAARQWLRDYDRAAEFDSERTLEIFGCELLPTDLQLANVFLCRFKKLESACNALRAAHALRLVIGDGRASSADETRQWNLAFAVGQQVQFWPDGRNGETYISKTSSPAFDTPIGPCILVEDYEVAVSLFNVQPSKINSPEVAA